MIRKGKCKHFNGIMNSRCEKGIRYKNFGERSMKLDYPCFDESNDSCAFRELPTDEEIEQAEKELNIHMDNMREAMKRIQEANPWCKPEFNMNLDNKKRGGSGEVECPVCKGHLMYSISPGNHHIWGKCQTANCLSWMM